MYNVLLHTNTVVMPITISRVNADDTIVKETIASTMGYRKNLLPVDTVVFGLMHAGGKWGETSTARSNSKSTTSTSLPFPRKMAGYAPFDIDDTSHGNYPPC